MKKHIANAIVSLFLSACILSAATNDFIFYQVPASGSLTRKLVTPGTSKLVGWGSSASTPVAITIGSGLSLNTSTNTLTASGGGGSGTVTSVALSVPSILAVAGSPVTTSGTIALSLASQSANRVFAGPTTGADATPTFRALVADDIPSLSSVYQPLASALTTLSSATAAGLALMDDADAAAQRTTLGLASAALLGANQIFTDTNIFTVGPTEELVVLADAQGLRIRDNAVDTNTINLIEVQDEDGNQTLVVDSGGALTAVGGITAASFSGTGSALTGLHASNIASGTVATARLGSGTANSSTFLRGDNTWATPAGSGTVTATSGTLTASAIMVGNGTTDIKALASLGTTTTVLHGNAAGLPTWGAVALATDVSGTLPVANGGTGITALGTGVATALGVNVGTAGSVVVNGGALGTPSSGTLTNATGLPPAGVTGTAAILGANTFTGIQSMPGVEVTGYTGLTNGLGTNAGVTVEFFVGGGTTLGFYNAGKEAFMPADYRIGWGNANWATGAFSAARDIYVGRGGAGILSIYGASSGAAIEVTEMTEPAAPDANKARIFIEDNGAGKTRLMVRFPGGASQQIAIEP